MREDDLKIPHSSEKKLMKFIKQDHLGSGIPQSPSDRTPDMSMTHDYKPSMHPEIEVQNVDRI